MGYEVARSGLPTAAGRRPANAGPIGPPLSFSFIRCSSCGYAREKTTLVALLHLHLRGQPRFGQAARRIRVSCRAVDWQLAEPAVRATDDNYREKSYAAAMIHARPRR
jgi:hypothetical protein